MHFMALFCMRCRVVLRYKGTFLYKYILLLYTVFSKPFSFQHDMYEYSINLFVQFDSPVPVLTLSLKSCFLYPKCRGKAIDLLLALLHSSAFIVFFFYAFCVLVSCLSFSWILLLVVEPNILNSLISAQSTQIFNCFRYFVRNVLFSCESNCSIQGFMFLKAAFNCSNSYIFYL